MSGTRKSVTGYIQGEFEAVAEYAKRVAREAAALVPLAGLEGFDYLYVFALPRGEAGVTFTFSSEGSSEAAREFVKTLCGRLRAVAKKSFDEATGMMLYIIKTPDFNITVKTSPAACKIEKVEEEVSVPARTEKRVRYRIANPEECWSTQGTIPKATEPTDASV